METIILRCDVRATAEVCDYKGATEAVKINIVVVDSALLRLSKVVSK